jgi:hypothetical protein
MAFFIGLDLDNRKEQNTYQKGRYALDLWRYINLLCAFIFYLSCFFPR